MFKKYYKFWLTISFIWLLGSFGFMMLNQVNLLLTISTGLAVLFTLFLFKELNLKIN